MKKTLIRNIITLFFAVISFNFIGLMTAHAGILTYDGQADVFIRPADGTSPYSFPVYVKGNEIELSYWEEKDNFQYTFTYKSRGGNIEITPKTGYKITSVILNDGYVDVWDSDTPATKEQIQNQQYQTKTYHDLTDPAISANFFEKFDDGVVNYNGKFIFTQSFLTKSPYVGWKKGEPLIFAVGKAPGPGGTLTMTVTTEFIHSDGVKIIAENEPPFTAYGFNNRTYVGHQQLEDAINEAIQRHTYSPGYIITIENPMIKAVKSYEWPPNPHVLAYVTIGGGRVFFTLVPDCQMVITLVFNGPSKGQIISAKTLPLNPDVPPNLGSGVPDQLAGQGFFNTFVNYCVVNVEEQDSGAVPQTFYDYNGCNNYLKTIPSDTDVSLTFNFKEDYYMKSTSAGNITNDGKTLNFTLTGPTALTTDANGATEPQGSWTGDILAGSNGEPEYDNGIPHYDPDTMGWDQEYADAEAVTTEITMASSAPKLAVDEFSAAEAFGGSDPGQVIAAYISNYSVLDENVLEGAKIRLSGECVNTTRPDGTAPALPVKEYPLSTARSSDSYCGYWFYPLDNQSVKYQYTYNIKAELVMPDGSIGETLTYNKEVSSGRDYAIN